MNKITKVFFVFLFLNFFQNVSALELKNPFKKKEVKPVVKMVETKQQWDIEAQNVPLIERDLNKKEETTDKKTEKIKMPDLRYTFEKYNYPQGKRELNIEEIKNKLALYPYIVADKDCKYAAYPYYYYSPDINQISSNFYVEKLDTSKNRIKRILEYNHKQQERIPIIESGTKEIYPNLFSGLTLVDWSNDSKKLLIKEKIGSTYGGIYKTYLYVHFLGNDIEPSRTIKLLDFDTAIKNYYLDLEKKQLIKYRYDIEPLGFSNENDNIILALCYVYDKDNKKIFLGTWGYNLANNSTLLFSKTDYIQQTSVNGLILRETLD